VTVETHALPKGNKEQLARAIDQHVSEQEAGMTYRWAVWTLAYLYLSGMREFQLFDTRRGRVLGTYTDEQGVLRYQSQELLSHIDRVVGQLLGMDVWPLVQRQGSSIGAIRSRATAQIILDSVHDRQTLQEAHRKFVTHVVTLGSAGITSHVEDHPVAGLTADHEVIHPKELFPYPSLGADLAKQRGLIRRRMVPLEWLKGRMGNRRIGERELQKMRWVRARHGQSPEVTGSVTDAALGDLMKFSGGSGGYASGNVKDGELPIYVELDEVWMWGHRGVVERYVVKSGHQVLMDEDTRGIEAYCPIGHARFMENSNFHAAGMFDLLYGVHRRVETLMEGLFRNVESLDRYGVLVLPGGQLNERTMLRDVGDGMKVVNWDPDSLGGEVFRPFAVSPFNSGDVPGKTAAFARQVMQEVSPFQDLLREKGRVDSQVGLSYLDAQIRNLMTTCTESLGSAWSKSHRSAAAKAGLLLTLTDQALPVRNLTMDLLGAKVDMSKDSVSFYENPMPQLSRLTIGIKAVNPQSELARKQEAMSLLGAASADGTPLTDAGRLKLLSLSEGLDFAMYLGPERAAYEAMIRQILVLYGDGDTPGTIFVTPDMLMPEIQMPMLDEVMKGPEMLAASPEVINEFMALRQMLVESTGMMLPAGVPQIEDMAVQMAAMQQGQGQGPGPQEQQMM